MDEDTVEGIKVLKGYLRVLIDAADVENDLQIERNRSLHRHDDEESTDSGSLVSGTSAFSVKAIATKLYHLIDTPLGNLAANAVVNNWETVVKVATRLAVLLAPAAFLLSVSAIVCEHNQSKHAVDIIWFNEDIKRINAQTKRMQECTSKICALMNKAWVAIENISGVYDSPKWIPAQVDHINDLLSDISAEIEVARKRFKMSEKWLQELSEKLEMNNRQRIVMNIGIWLCAAAVSGTLYYTGFIQGRTAVTASLPGGIPLMHTLLGTSVDVHKMLAEIHRKEMLHEELALELMDYETELDKIKRHYRHQHDTSE